MEKFETNKYWILLTSLFGMFMLNPLLENLGALEHVISIAFLMLLAFSVIAVTHSKKSLTIALLLVLPLILYQLDFRGSEDSDFFLIYFFVSASLFFAHMIFLIGKEVFLSKRVSLSIISGAICVYVLLGIMWAFFYGLAQVIEPGSFSVAIESSDSVNNFMYFSMVTLTTLGYGDIVPVSSIAKSLATMEAMIGQIYMTVLVARLVGIHLSQNMQGK